jgi:L-ascorbate metabolism protein UlaG (beta-lactamase superfamily)
MIERIEWLGHASFRIQGTPLIYIDPWRVARNAPRADIILITHDHYDHCSPPDVEKLRGPNTVILANNMAASVLGEGEGIKVLRPWQVYNIGRACIKAIPAYNSHHPKAFEGLGFVISLDHHDIYYAGDTDLIPEMSMIRPDIAILPIGGRQTMNVEDAVEAVRRLRPRWAVPSHWGTPSEGGTNLDARIFSEHIEGLAQPVTPEPIRQF